MSISPNRRVLAAALLMSKSPASDQRRCGPDCHALSSVGAMANTFFTIGHSTRTIVEFADLLQESGVNLVVDVRSILRARTNPQFNQQGLPEALAPWQIGYEHIAELGGLRGNPRGAEPSRNAYWRVRSFRNYADYALTAPFAAGMARLRERGSGHRCAIMCAEAVWWHCHRGIIAGDAHPRDVARR